MNNHLNLTHAFVLVSKNGKLVLLPLTQQPKGAFLWCDPDPDHTKGLRIMLQLLNGISNIVIAV